MAHFYEMSSLFTSCREGKFSEVRLYVVLRRLMRNYLNQQVRQVAQRSAEGVVYPLGARVGRDLGGQTRKQTSQRLGPVALQREEVLELAYDPLDDLALARGPSPIDLRPGPAGVVVGGGSNECPVLLQPTPLPLYPGEALVGQVCVVEVGGYEGLPDRALVGGGHSQTEGSDDALGVYHQGHLEPVDPLGLGGAPSEARLTAEKPLASFAGPHPHDGRDQRRVHHAVDGPGMGELSGEGSLQSANLCLQGSHPSVELALRTKVREVGAQVRGGEAPEVPLASEAGPLGEDGQGQNLRVGEQCRPTGSAWQLRGGLELPLDPWRHHPLERVWCSIRPGLLHRWTELRISRLRPPSACKHYRRPSGSRRSACGPFSRH